MLEVTIAAAPHRDRKSLRRGVFHNSKRLDDGTWTWRYDSFRTGFAGLWDDVPAITMPTTLIRGGDSHFVSDDDAETVARTAPGFRRTYTVAGAGHSVQAISRARWWSCCGASSNPERVASSSSVGSQLIAKLQ